ncbi:MAG: non-homologous end-joining DNA ligase [Nitriliruptoraceae bacterium]
MSSPLDRLDQQELERLVEEPLPDWLDPMLATLTDERFSDPDWLFERKLDGERVLAYRSASGVRLVSRNGTALGDTYPELVEAVQAATDHPCVLDGEVVAFEGSVTSFAKLQPRLQLSDPDEARASGVAVFYYVFDLLHLDGRSTRDLPLRRRKALLAAALDAGDPVRLVPHRNEEGEAWLEEACAKGWEGLIAKRADAPYHHGRSRDWLKFTCVDQQELVIGGYTEPEGQRQRFGALLVGYHEDGDLRYAGKVGTGFDGRTLEQLGDLLARRERSTSPFEDGPEEPGVRFVTPDLVAQVGFTEWTRDGRLRHPRYLGLRDDKDASEVVRERPT